MADMELRHLRYFLAVAEERHMTRAAERLGIQQPPLSQQIRALETELGVRLFTRGARGVDLTVAGRSLQSDAVAILAAVGLATTRAQQAARGQTGTLSVGFTTSAVLHPLATRIIRSFRERFGQVGLQLHEDAAADLIEAIQRREIKVAILRVPVARPQGVAFRELAQEELLAVLPAGHRLVGQSGIELSDLAGERFILVRRPGAPGIYQNVILACRAAGFEPMVGGEVPHMLSSINLVAAGAGISFVPASMREVNLRQVVYVPIRPDPGLSVPLTLAYVADDADPVLANFIEIAGALCGGFAGPASDT